MDVTLNWIDTTNGAGVYKIYRSDKGIDVNFLPEPLDITISEYTHESQLNPDSGLPGTDINGGSNQRWLTAKDTVADGGLYQYIISVSDDSGGESFSEVMYFGNNSDLEPISFLAGSEVPFEYRMVGGTGTIDYGDGTVENLVADTPTRIVHTYSEATSHIVTIQLITPAVLLEVSADSLLEWGSGYYKIHIRNPKMRLPEEFTYDLESMEGMLSGWEGVSDISGWEVTNVRDMDNLFLNSPLFNQDLSRWKVGNVWWLNNTFNKASAFNGNLKRWGLHSVISMDGTFANATLFDSKINLWDVSNVRSMEGMFGNASKFNQDLSLWCVKQFDNAPLNFDTSATAWALPKPVWGTCPVVPDTTTIELRRTPTGENYGYGEDQLIIRFNGTGALVDFNDGSGENWYWGEAVHYYDEIDYNVEKVATLRLDNYCDLLETNADKVIRWGSKYDSVKFTSNIKEVPLTLGEDITSCAYMFSDATEFNGDVSGWDVSNVTDMSGMFARCRMFNQDLSGWDVSNVTSIYWMFNGCESFNGNVSTWNTSKVKDMGGTFYGCALFDQDLSGWDVSNVENMYEMFFSCYQFNQDLSGWDVSQVTDMRYMFSNCNQFNQDLSGWCVSNHPTRPYEFDTDTTEWALPKPVWGTCPPHAGEPGTEEPLILHAQGSMHLEAPVGSILYSIDGGGTWNENTEDYFTVDLPSGVETAVYIKSNDDVELTDPLGVRNTATNTDNFRGVHQWWESSRPIKLTVQGNPFYVPEAAPPNITNMRFMFHSASAFNQDLSSWDVSNVTNMRYMFFNANAFNSDISQWNVSKVTEMDGMFQDASAFNQDLSSWDVSKVTDMSFMFHSARSFNQDVSRWDVSSVWDMGYMFSNANAFNQDLSKWCVSNITSKPTDFDSVANSWTLPRPVWGTCPIRV